MNNREIISKLDRLVRWGYDRRKIDGKLLEGFQEVIKSLSEIDEPSRADNYVELSMYTAEISFLRSIAGFSGFTQKGLAILKEMNEDFLNWFAVNGFTIKTEVDFYCFISICRYFNTMCDIDLRNIAFYRKLIGLTNLQNKEKMRPYLDFMKELCPHLSKYFEAIESGGDFDEIEVNESLYRYHLKTRYGT